MTGAKKFILFAGAFLLGALVMYIVSPNAPGQPSKMSSNATVWTCSMHPQIRKSEPGNCPICGMKLVSAASITSQSSSGNSTEMLTLSDAALAMASVDTVPITRRELRHEIRAVGKIQYNETGLATIATRTDGYIERLFVDYTGIKVKKGDHLVEIYSPDLVVGFREMLIGRGYKGSSTGVDLVENSRTKLRQWGVTDEQIDRVLKTGKVEDRVTLYSPINGTVVEKMVVDGSFVKRGDILYRLANLESVWVLIDIYEYELAWIQHGQSVEVTAEAYPGQTFKGMVTFISPTLNEETRTVKVRVNLSNPEEKLKPGMFLNAVIRVGLLSSGRPAPTGLEGKFTCPMHPEVLKEAPGNCPICQMKLEQIPGKPIDASADHKVLAVPKSAVLDSGERKIVYIEKARGQFVAAEITVGPRAGDFFPVISGLKEGDRVAVRGNFLLDSQFQIQGIGGLFSGNAAAPVTPHSGMQMPGHEGMQMPATPSKPTDISGHKH